MEQYTLGFIPREGKSETKFVHQKLHLCSSTHWHHCRGWGLQCLTQCPQSHLPGPRTLTSIQSVSNSPWGGVRAIEGGIRMSAATKWCWVHCRQSTGSSQSMVGSSTWQPRTQMSTSSICLQTTSLLHKLFPLGSTRPAKPMIAYKKLQ